MLHGRPRGCHHGTHAAQAEERSQRRAAAIRHVLESIRCEAQGFVRWWIDDELDGYNDHYN